MNWSTNSGYGDGFKQNEVLWNASASKSFLKNNQRDAPFQDLRHPATTKQYLPVPLPLAIYKTQNITRWAVISWYTSSIGSASSKAEPVPATKTPGRGGREEVRWGSSGTSIFNPLSGDFIKSGRNKERTGLVFT